MKKFILKLALLPFAVPIIILGASTYAFAGENVDVSVSVDYTSEYVFRGVTLAGDALQPSIEVSKGNFSIGAWASLPLENAGLYDTEIDLYAGYEFTLSDTTSLDVGFNLYHYPESGGLFDIGAGAGDASTVEFYSALGFDIPMEPSISAYYDINLKALTLEGEIAHSFPLGAKTSFDMGGTLGTVSVDGPGDYQYGSISGAFSLAISDAVSTYVGINAGFSSDDTFFDLSNFRAKGSSTWIGAGLSTDF